MEIHNTTEDIVFAEVEAIFTSLEKGDNPDKFCLCPQCRLDTACYALNRAEPRYIVSNRGVARIEQEGHARQQKDADIISLIWEGIKKVNHNQRPYAHNGNGNNAGDPKTPLFNFPTIVGRLFNGTNFEPLSNVNVELLRDGKQVAMKDKNWQNPYHLVSNTQGTFTFWPAPVEAESDGERQSFEFSVRIEAPGFETLQHFFRVPVIGEFQNRPSYSMERTFKLPDLYAFPPGEGDDEGDL
ncbi:MAG: late competence development ComFB family protein [Treponema sp.]|jgi:competence protein ComFB|nr:late competence development ComFB family protein [Treponema sp.]